MSWPDHRRLRWTPTLRVPADDGTEIAVEVLGDGHSGPTVVFTHGWTFSSRSWHYQRMLAERWRLVLMDHRDHGESGTGPRDHRTIDQIGRDLLAVIEATCGGRGSGAKEGAGRGSGAKEGAGRASGAREGADKDVVLVDHSMGGMTIMSLAAQHEELSGSKVKAVALV